MAAKKVAKGSRGSKGKSTRLTVQNMPWGCIYTGTRADLIAAKIASEENFPDEESEFSGYYYVKNHKARVMSWRVSGPGGERPKRGIHEVWINYEGADLPAENVARRAKDEIGSIAARLLALIDSVRPRPLSLILGIPGVEVLR
jgi:hypothetical protein